LEVDLCTTLGALEQPRPCEREGLWQDCLDKALKACSTKEAQAGLSLGFPQLPIGVDDAMTCAN
jgi:hypothetical protein